MKIDTDHDDSESRTMHPLQVFTPLEQVTRSHVTTAEAAHFLSRRPQTLRQWAMTGSVIAPIRVNGRLAWPVAGIRALLGMN